MKDKKKKVLQVQHQKDKAVLLHRLFMAITSSYFKTIYLTFLLSNIKNLT